LRIVKNVTISGPGANLLAVSRDQNAPGFRIFHVAPNHTVIIQGITITHGIDVTGAGIWNDHATTHREQCAITGNSATDSKYAGGGILNDGFCCGLAPGPATLNVANSTISAILPMRLWRRYLNLGLGFPALWPSRTGNDRPSNTAEQAGRRRIAPRCISVATVANSTLSDRSKCRRRRTSNPLPNCQ